MGVSSRQSRGSGQGGSLGENPSDSWEGFTWTQNQCRPEWGFWGRFRGSLTWAQTWCRPRGQFEGVLGRSGGSHLGTDPVQPGSDGAGWALTAEHVALQHLRQGVPGHVCKVPRGERGGYTQDHPGPLPTQSELGLGALGVRRKVGAIPLPVSPAAQWDRAGLVHAGGGHTPLLPSPRTHPTPLHPHGGGLILPHTCLFWGSSLLGPHGPHLPNPWDPIGTWDLPALCT